MQHLPVRQGKGGGGRAWGLNLAVGGHAVDQGAVHLPLGGDEQAVVGADPVPLQSAVLPLHLHKDAGEDPFELIAGAGNGRRIQLQHRLIGGDVLAEVGGARVRREGVPGGRALVPVVGGLRPHKVVAHRPGGQGLTDVGPAGVLPVLDRGGVGAPRPEGLHRQLPVVAVRAGEGGHHALHRLRGDGHLPVLVPLLAAGAAGGGAPRPVHVGQGDGGDLDKEQTAAKAGEDGHHDQTGDGQGDGQAFFGVQILTSLCGTCPDDHP